MKQGDKVDVNGEPGTFIGYWSSYEQGRTRRTWTLIEFDQGRRYVATEDVIVTDAYADFEPAGNEEDE